MKSFQQLAQAAYEAYQAEGVKQNGGKPFPWTDLEPGTRPAGSRQSKRLLQRSRQSNESNVSLITTGRLETRQDGLIFMPRGFGLGPFLKPCHIPFYRASTKERIHDETQQAPQVPMKKAIRVTIEKVIEIELMPSMFGGLTEDEYIVQFKRGLWTSTGWTISTPTPPGWRLTMTGALPTTVWACSPRTTAPTHGSPT
ncbi:hypothetical protein [Polaromonas sp. UC242_47]|uniref:hypothetical protein n=1 Tax=Polaromonas sp. UC242_47 TaxID=3374626 RepID=UPI0037B23D32